MVDSPYPWSPRRRPALFSLALLAAGGGLLALVARRLVRVEVEGPSMLPSLAPGERLLIWRTTVLEEGDIVALHDPASKRRLLVKRVVRLEAERVEVEGDNSAASRDSRHFGPVPRRLVIGRAVYRYHPPAAAGRL